MGTGAAQSRRRNGERNPTGLNWTPVSKRPPESLQLFQPAVKRDVRLVTSGTEELDNEARLRLRYIAIPTQDLLRISKDPEFSRTAHVVARQTLLERGLSLEEIDSWRPFEIRSRKRQRSERSPADWKRLAEQGVRMAKVARRFSGPLASVALATQGTFALIAAFGIAVSMVFFVVVALSVPSSSWVDPDYSLFHALGKIVGGYIGFTFFTSPLIALSWLQVTFLARRWKQPARILLLRPFDRSEISRNLARIVKQCVFKFGHTYTLSDRFMKTPWYFSYTAIVGRMTGLFFRHPLIADMQLVEVLCLKLGDEYRRNVNWLYSNDKIFPVTCSEDLWSYCVQRLLGEVDVILIDLSGLHAGVVDEVEECLKLERMELVIFMTSTEWKAQVRGWLAERRSRSPLIEGVPLFCYDAGGRTDLDALDAAILDTLTGKRSQTEAV